jgi:hypothetical protein
VIREYEARLRSPEVSVQIVTPDDIQVEIADEVGQKLPESLRNWLRAQQKRNPEPQGVQRSFLGSLLQGRVTEDSELLGSTLAQGEAAKLRLSTDQEKDFAVPLFEEGSHPNDPAAEVLGAIRIKRSVVPEKEIKHLLNPFAWRLTDFGTERVHRVLKPRDVVIISEDLKTPEPKEIFAVRYMGRLVLSRVLRKGSVTLLLSSRGETEIEVLEDSETETALVGRIALVIRAWHYAVFAPTDYTQG